MCGIFGFAGKPTNPGLVSDIIESLASWTSFRGGDATGAAYLLPPCDKSKTGLWYHREATDADEWLKRRVIPDALYAGTNLLVGHCRFSTHGDEKHNKNNHPHFSNDNNIAIVHNGVIHNFEALDAQFSLPRRSECDSETIAQLLGQYLAVMPPRIAPRKARILETLSELDDHSSDFAVAALDSQAKCIWLFRNYSNPLSLVEIKGLGVTIFASEKDHIHEAICANLTKRQRKRLGYKASHITSITPGQALALTETGAVLSSRDVRTIHVPQYKKFTFEHFDTNGRAYGDYEYWPDLDRPKKDYPYSWTPKSGFKPSVVNGTYPPAPSSLTRHLLSKKG